MSKFNKEQKIEIYRKWKDEKISISQLSKAYKMNLANLDYMLRLIDMHGTNILNTRKWVYSKKFKADLISKSRIEWMNQVRPLIAKYVAAVPMYIYMYNRYSIENNGSLKKLNYKMDEIEKLYNELNLYIPDTRGASCLN